MESIPFDKGAIVREVLHDDIEATIAVADIKPTPVVGAKHIVITIDEAKEGTDAINNRSGAFTFYVSNDGVNFIAYNMMIDNVTNANDKTLTRVASKTRNSLGTDILFFTPETLGGITHIKVVPTITDGAAPVGLFTVVATISF